MPTHKLGRLFSITFALAALAVAVGEISGVSLGGVSTLEFEWH